MPVALEIALVMLTGQLLPFPTPTPYVSAGCAEVLGPAPPPTLPPGPPPPVLTTTIYDDDEGTPTVPVAPGADDDSETVARLGRLPPPIVESSGLAWADSAGQVWTHGDGGTPATLYRAGLDGRLRGSLPLAPLPNHDWEELTRDPAGRFYMGPQLTRACE